MSPYIVTTKKPVERAVSLVDDREREVTARCAVATLEEARKMAEAFVMHVSTTRREDYLEVGYGAFGNDCFNLQEPGGKVGPLPDGTVIEVEPIRMSKLRTMVEHELGQYGDDDQVLAAFNEAQGGPR